MIEELRRELRRCSLEQLPLRCAARRASRQSCVRDLLISFDREQTPNELWRCRCADELQSIISLTLLTQRAQTEEGKRYDRPDRKSCASRWATVSERGAPVAAFHRDVELACGGQRGRAVCEARVLAIPAWDDQRPERVSRSKNAVEAHEVKSRRRH